LTVYWSTVAYLASREDDHAMGRHDDAWKSELREAFGARVRALRVETGIPQDAFALKIGVHRTWIGSVERGEKAPTLYGLADLAAGFEMSISELLDGIEIPD
jgi:DNA-binding XRE family transcriptional regulator